MDKLYLEHGGEKTAEMGLVDPFIELSLRIINALDQLSSEYNKNNPSKVTKQQLKKIYLKEVDSSLQDNDKNVFALARVIMFLRFKSGEKVFANKIKKVDPERQEIKALIFEETTGKKHRNINMFLDISNDWSPSEEDFSKAEQYAIANNLNFKVKRAEDLYLNEYKPVNITWD